MGILDGLEGFMERFTPYLNKIVIFFLILFIGFLVGKIIGRLVRKILRDIKTDAFVNRTLGWKLSLERTISSLVAGLVYLVSFILALNAVGLTTLVLEIILGVFVLAIVLSFLIALKDIIPNAAAGLTIRQKVKEGVKVKMDDAEGKVKEVNLLETIVQTKNGDTIVVPNALFAKQLIRIKRR